MTKKITERKIEFTDPHKLVLTTTFESPIRDPETGKDTDGTEMKRITEPKSVAEIRESQARNLEILKEIREKLEGLQAQNVPRPEPLVARLAQLQKDIEAINSYRKAQNAVDAHAKALEDQKDNERRALEVIQACNEIMAQRRKQFPDASVEPIDEVQV